MEHPDISRTLQTGYPKPEPEERGEDIFGNVVIEGEEILIINTKGDFIARDYPEEQMIQVLIGLGAMESYA